MQERLSTGEETGNVTGTNLTTFPTTFIDVSGWNRSGTAPCEFEVEVLAFAAEVLDDLAIVGDCLSGKFEYGLLKGGESITLAASTKVVASASIDATENTFTSVAHGFSNAQGPVRLPGGTALATDYWIIVVDDDTFQIAESKADAVAGTALDLSSAGVGNQTVNIPTRAYRELLGHSYRTKGYGFYCGTHTNGAQVRISVHAVERKLV
jgi:hypothetical protein